MEVGELRRFEGCRIDRIRRVFFEVDGRLRRSSGGLELAFDHSDAVVLDAAGDGQRLRISEGLWVDPFDEQLSPANASFVAEAGKLTAVDVSAEPLYMPLVGDTVRRIRPSSYEFDGVVTGAFIETPRRAILGECRFDEFYVTVIDLDPPATPGG